MKRHLFLKGRPLASWSGPEPLELRVAPAPLIVSTGADNGAGSLRAAIEAANAQAGLDTISFVGVSKIKLLAALPAITDDLSIEATRSLTVDGRKAVQLMSMAGDGVDVTLGRIKFVNGKAESGAALQINVPNGSVTVRNCTFSGNLALVEIPDEPEEGMAAAAVPEGFARGGAIVNQAGTLTIEASKFTGNRVVRLDENGEGGAIYNAGILNITGSTFSKNRVQAFVAEGGAIYNETGAELTLVRSRVTGNLALGATGIAGYRGANGEQTSDPGEPGGDGEEGGNGYDGGAARGGGIVNLGTLSVQEESSVSKNKALGGAGGAGGKGGNGGKGGPRQPPFLYDGYTYPGVPAGPRGIGGPGGPGGNGGEAQGGGIWSGAGLVTIEHSHLDGNAALAGLAGKGGAPGKGLGKGGRGNAGLPGDEAIGGGIYNHGALKVIGQSTVSKNVVQAKETRGGGIASLETAVLEVIDSEISKNRARAGKGANGEAGDRGFNGDRGAPGENGGDGEEGGEGSDGIAGGDSLGGGIYNAGVLTVKTSIVSGNLAKAGAGGKGGVGGKGGKGGAGGPRYSYEGEVLPRGRRGAPGSGGSGGFGGDAGSAQGGGIFNTRILFNNGDEVQTSAGEVTIESSRIEKNITVAGLSGEFGKGGAAGGGGALKGANGFTGGESASDGGGLYSLTGKLTVSGLTSFIKNKAGTSGGGISVVENIATLIENATISQNSARVLGGGLCVARIDGGPVYAISCTIVLNKAPIDPQVFGPIETAPPA